MAKEWCPLSVSFIIKQAELVHLWEEKQTTHIKQEFSIDGLNNRVIWLLPERDWIIYDKHEKPVPHCHGVWWNEDTK